MTSRTNPARTIDPRKLTELSPRSQQRPVNLNPLREGVPAEIAGHAAGVISPNPAWTQGPHDASERAPLVGLQRRVRRPLHMGPVERNRNPTLRKAFRPISLRRKLESTISGMYSCSTGRPRGTDLLRDRSSEGAGTPSKTPTPKNTMISSRIVASTITSASLFELLGICRSCPATQLIGLSSLVRLGKKATYAFQIRNSSVQRTHHSEPAH